MATAARDRKEEEVERSLTVRTRLSCGVISRQEVPIGGPSTTDNPKTFRGAHITVANNWDKNTLSVYNGKALVYTNSGEIVASGGRITANNKEKNTWSVYNGEVYTDPDTGEVIVDGILLTADGEQETVTALNADLITDKETVSLKSDRIELTYNDRSIGITVSGGKAEGETKAKLNIGKDKNVISFDGKSIVVECGDDIEISAEYANMCVNSAEGKLHLEGSDANFRAGEAERFIPKVKNACVDLATGNIYCNGEFVCCAPLLGGQLRKLFKVGPKPASTLASSLLTSY
ncbi:MAG: hypothetical protein NNC23_01645 [Candidatus Nanosynbacter sp. P2B_S1_bin.0.1]|nr:hypothetical protein [Candidatus Nanosynbacter sp. P2B_S1_bin.0.1]